ncbi:MAG: polysaccharide deacetylase family protein [Candidatus Pacebacteria bacterium]|nr:polysaccharide deacetylase family protein [Candidatus Paceibacterota bacterium]
MHNFFRKNGGNIAVAGLLSIVLIICTLDFVDRLTDSMNNPPKTASITSGANQNVSAYKPDFPILSDKAIITISFDDNGGTVYTEAFPRMEKLGLKGTNYVITNNIGGKGLLTKDELQEMYDEGWSISNHTLRHINLVSDKGITDGRVVSAVKDARNRLIAYGWTNGAGEFCAPFDTIDEHILFLIDPYITSSTSSQKGLNDFPLDLTHISRQGAGENPPEVVISWIDEAIKNKQYMHLYFHQIGPQGGLYYPPEKFQKIIDYIAAKERDGSLKVKTMHELSHGL